MRLVFLLFLLPWQFLCAQKTYIPFELERYSSNAYADMISDFNATFQSEEDALQFYFLAYKLQRAIEPSDYFPKSNENKELAADYLRVHFPKGSAMALINFLESRGSLESCNALINKHSDNIILLPYKFMAAYILGNKNLENQCLDEMDKTGILSDVLKSFGENAMQSIPNNTLIISQGMQDLIAFEYAAKQTKKNIKIINVFAEKCEGYSDLGIDEILEKNKVNIWVSPSISSDFSTQHKQSLYLWGIGFALSEREKNLAKTIESSGRNFAGLTDKAQNPADKGLIQSYSYFAKAYQAFALESGDDLDMSKSVKISLFIKNQTQ